MVRHVLAITTSADHRRMLDLVRHAVEARGARFVEFHTDHFPTSHRLTQRTDGATERFFVDIGDGPVEIGPEDAVWHRRIAFANHLPRQMEAKLREGAVMESKNMAEGWLTAVPAFAVDRFDRITRAKRKSWQQALAHEVGLRIPRTCLTNDPAEARAFFDTCPHGAIAKMLSSWAWYDEAGREHVVMTTEVDRRTLDHLDELRFSPMHFQEKVPKAYELRVTVVGHRVFSARINSQQITGAEVDWRAKGAESVHAWVAEPLPPEIERRLLALVDRTGLQYSAADFIVTPDGDYVFLEANAVGEWFWLQLASPGFPIAEALADVLTDQPGARRPLPAEQR